MDHRALLEKYISGEITQAERNEFSQWLSTLSEKEYHDLLLEHETLMTSAIVNRPENPALLEGILRRIDSAEPAATPVVPMRVRKRHWRISVAAAILLLLGSAAFFAIEVKWGGKGRAATSYATNDIPAPVGAKATLTLVNGKRIILDSMQVGTIAQEGKTGISKLNGNELAYHGSDAESNELQFNMLSTGKGGQTIVTLADGTKVWLNALSSLKYPTHFTGKRREVEIRGEGYFEVHSNAAAPFIVKVNGSDEIEVLGTHFNVNAYGDEPVIKTTLFEGAISVGSYKEHVLIKPGEQAIISNANQASPIKKVLLADADLDGVQAWKEGRFQFSSENIYSIFKQAARWYDMTVTYKDSIPFQFSGEIPRDVPVSQLLKILSATDKVNFEINENKITVTKN